MKHKKTVWISTASLLVCIIGLGCWLVLFRPFVRTNDALIDGFKVAVSADIMARIIKLHVDEGDTVHKGDLIAELDGSILESQRIEAIAKIATLGATISVAESRFEKIFNDYQRAVKGFSEGVTSAQQLDHAQKNNMAAEARVTFAKASFEQAQTELGVIEEKLRHTKIFASIDGTIVKRWVWEGDVVQIGQSLYSLYDLSNVWVLANLEETKMQNVRLGNSVSIHIDSFPDLKFHGEIFAIKGAAASQFSLIPQDNATGNYTKVAQRVPLKISIQQGTGKEAPYLFPGMSAEIRVRVR